MTRIAAREIAVHMIYALDFSPDLDEIIKTRLNPGFYLDLAGEDPVFAQPPNEKQAEYIRRLVKGVDEHLPELDGYIEKYAKGWGFGRLPRVSIAVMRVCMYEALYCPDIPRAAAVNAAVEISKKYEPGEMTSFINGILGTFIRSELGDQ
ncbi:MAG: transcription antitermination factor NusB [Oscillospiraceae bacterium]|nr:transcription antitermination factor NusB [Oscillospiraceae bacterium]